MDEAVSESVNFEPDVGIFAEVAGDVANGADMQATRGRDSQAGPTGTLDEPVTDLSTTESTR